ncbi:MAG TPA: hypothetical protein VLA34_15600, partial [Candidatus Krumholzibacterium sp.]|nr:hypothetical protein [Candidatus Krumholzibacterium sp.]
MANAITLSGSPISAAASPNPDLCRISGYLINAQGQALKGWAFTLRYCYSPLGVDPGTIVLQERMTIKADKNGYVEFDLLRGAKVVAEFPNLLTVLNASPLTVPDAASADLLGFLFPYVVSVDWEDASPVVLGVDEAVTLSLLGTLSNGETVTMTASSVEISSSNEAVIKQKEGLAWLAV